MPTRATAITLRNHCSEPEMNLHPLIHRSLAVIVSLTTLNASAGPLLDRWAQRHAGDATSGLSRDDAADMGGGTTAMSCAEWSRRVDRLQERRAGRYSDPRPDLPDVAYGEQPRQRLDVYLSKPTMGSARPTAAPIIVMVHGGGWCVGDKGGAHMVQYKLAHWQPKGFVFISTNYPMVSDGSDALAQAHHIARAVTFVQAHAGEWGADPGKVILMGHSAGAHLVSLVGADPELRTQHRLQPLLGVVSLDAGAIDVPRQMPQVYPFLKLRYREAFGDSEAQWIKASPMHRTGPDTPPWLGVCSTQRKDRPCDQAQDYSSKLHTLGVNARTLPLAKSHGAINADLGKPGDYTAQVDAFMAGLDREVAERLKAGVR